MPKGDKFKLKADPEDGTTPIANLLLEALAIAHLTGTEKGLVLYLWRNTYGWVVKGVRLKQARLPQAELAESLGVTKKAVYSGLKTLTDKKVVFREDLGQGKGYIYRMNTKIASWNSDSIDLKALKKLVGVVKLVEGSQTLLPLTETTTLAAVVANSKLLPSTETTTLSIPKLLPPSIIKETIKETIKESPPLGKQVYGEGENVHLTDQEYEKLVAKFGKADAGSRIEHLSAWLASTGKKKKSHYFTILNWENLDKKKGQPMGGQQHGESKGKKYGLSKPVKSIDADTGEIS